MRITLGVFITIFLLMALPQVHALGLAYEYLENGTLTLAPGQNYFFKLTIQNNEWKNHTVQIDLNSDLANIVGDNPLFVGAKTYDRFVYFNISIPKNATEGDRFILSYSVNPINVEKVGQVPFSVAYDRALKIEIEGEGVVQKTDVESVPADINEAYLISEKGWNANIFLLIVVVLFCFVILILVVWRRADKVSKKLNPSVTDFISATHSTSPSGKMSTPFRTADGTMIHTIDELIVALQSMTEHTYATHVNAQKNDFASWIHTSLQRPKLAVRIAAAKTKEELIWVLHHAR